MGWLQNLFSTKKQVQPVHLTDQNFSAEVLQSDVPVLVDVWGPGCPPCRQLEPVIMALATDYEGRVKVCELNAAESPKTCGRYGVQGTPTVLYFKKGNVVERVVGYRPGMFHRQAIEALFGVAATPPE